MRNTRVRGLTLIVAGLLAGGPLNAGRDLPAAPPVLKPTSHPPLPSAATQYWLVPTSAEIKSAKSAAMAQFAAGVKLEIESSFAKALPLFAGKSQQQGVLADYARYYEGLAQLRLGRAAEAKQTFQALQARAPIGFLAEGSALREAESDEALSDPAAAMEIYERVSKTKVTQPDEVLMRLGRTARAAGKPEKAVEAYSRVLFEFPFSDLTAAAAAELETLPAPSVTPGSVRYKLELGRAERLFGAKRYSAARPIFETLRRQGGGDDKELLALRLAECDYFQKHARLARDGVKPYIEKASRQGEALFFYAVASRELGDLDTYYKTVRRLADEFKEQSWAEEALNNLATHYIVRDEDEAADAAFREMYEKFPQGHYGERAAWKIGWRAYRLGVYADTVRAFESGAASFPRSDYRPSWLYWSGRAYERLENRTAADERYLLLTTDYLNSYYGRLAAARLVEHGVSVPKRQLVTESRGVAGEPATDGDPLPPLPPNEPVIRALLALDLYDQAIDELRYAQRTWGDSAAIQATYGWIYTARGDFRAGINAMKRAYPQYLANGGEQMPIELQKIRFPVNYWPDIKRYSSQHGLDPYLMAALIAQESNFAADARSPANAYGLMQLLPSTGRQYARTLNISRRFSIGMLTTADANLRMGTAYFADLVKQFGGVHFALATYNAGPSRVSKWIAEKPGLEREEFIDDIPFPETQDYVRKLIGQAEDYKRLYGPGGASASDDVQRKTMSAAKRAPAPKTASKPKSTTKKKTPARRAQ